MERLRAFAGRSTFLRYGAAVGTVTLAVLARSALATVAQDKLPFAPFLIATVVAAWYGGVGPSRLSSVLGFVVVESIFVRHDSARWFLTPAALAVAISYFAAASAILLLIQANQRNRAYALARQLDLEREIAERVQAETDLRKSRDELELRVLWRTAGMKSAQERLTEQAALLQLAHDAILVTDLEGKISFWNSGAEGIYGWRADEAIGANVHELLRTILPAPMNEIAVILQNEGQWQGELTHATRTGQAVTVASRWSLQRDREGKPPVILQINRDVTERKRAEEALRHSEERYRALVVATSQIVWTADPNGMMTDAPSWQAFTGQSEDEVKGWKWLDSLHPEDRDRAVALWSDAVLHQSTYETEYRIRKSDGDFRHVSVRAVPVKRAGGSVRGWIGACTDVSERKRAQEALQSANARLSQLSRDLLRTQDYERRRIARELHDSTAQLLAALQINLTRLQDPGMDPDRRKRALSEAADLAAACSTEIRTVTYLLHPPVLDEVGLAGALQAYAQGFKQRTGIEVEIKLPPGFGRLSRELESTLFRIVQEGLANVHKHSGSPLAVIRLERDEHEARLYLQDRGQGLPLALRQRANGFVHFGVGILGMRERAEQLGGRLELDSNATGTRITVTLPLVQSNEKNANTLS